MLPKVARIIQRLLDKYEAILEWDTFRTKRTERILPIILRYIKGDILEIGAHEGITTKVFCEIGIKHDRHVHVIDPWDGKQQGHDVVFNSFNTNCSQFKNLIVQRLRSENPKVLRTFKKGNIKFAFILIDGMHSYDAVKNDLEKYKDLLEPHGIICIDDWRGPYDFSAKIRRAAKDHLDNTYHQLVTPDSFIETYFVKLL